MSEGDALKPKIKICCMLDAEEARLALKAGADALGFVSSMPSGPGVIPEVEIAEIIAGLPPGTDSFLLSSKTDADVLRAQVHRCRPATLQLCETPEPALLRSLREMLPDLRLVPVIHVRGADSVGEALALAEFADALLLDSGRPDAERKSLGGTGEVHDWSISREIREAATVPVFLAGGLNPENVGEALRVVEPDGLDVCSGVRTGGRLDEAKLQAFLKGAA